MNNQTYNDEIDIADLFKRLWQQRGLIIGCALLTSLLVVSFHFSKATFAIPKTVELSASLVFLDGNPRYPNGSVFSPRDIISSRVLTAVANNRQLDATALADAVSIDYSNSLLQKSEDKLTELLVNAKTPNDVRDAANKVLADMRALTRNTITLKIELNKAGITAEQGSQLLSELMETWAQQAIERGLMNVDVSYPTTPYKLAKNTNLIDAFEDITKYSASLLKAIEQLTKLSGSSSLIVNEQSLSDLNRTLQSIMSTDITPLRSFSYSNSAALATQDPSMRVRVQSRKRLLDLENKRLDKLIESYNNTLKQLVQNTNNNQSGQPNVASSQAGNAQFDQSFLDSLLDLGNKLSSVQIREEIYKRRMAAIEDKLNLEKEIEILRGSDTSAYEDINAINMLTEALQSISSEINLVQQQLGEFFTAYRQQTLNSGANLYIADAAPQVRGGAIQLGKKVILTVALGLMLGLFLGVILALIRSASSLYKE